MAEGKVIGGRWIKQKLCYPPSTLSLLRIRLPVRPIIAEETGEEGSDCNHRQGPAQVGAFDGGDDHEEQPADDDIDDQRDDPGGNGAALQAAGAGGGCIGDTSCHSISPYPLVPVVLGSFGLRQFCAPPLAKASATTRRQNPQT